MPGPSPSLLSARSGARVLLPALAAVWLASGGPALAICNVIPSAPSEFRAALGATSRPFASPGDVVEVRVRPTVCDGASTGYVDVDGDGSRSDDHVVLVLFVPPAGTANAALLAEDCTGIDLAPCTAQLGGGTAECVEANGPGQPRLSVPGQLALQLSFPDSDARLDAPDDDRTFAGPAKLVVSRRGQPLQCQLATSRCADLGGDTSTHGVVACVDELFELDGTCRTGTGEVAATFGHFSALPPPNNYLAMVNQGGVTEVRFTTDAAGNLLAPMDYTGVPLRLAGLPPIARLARLETDVDAFSSAPGVPLALPGDGFVHSYSPEGIVLPPVFAALSDPSDPANAVLFGSVDALRGVVRLARRGCVGGEDEGEACNASGDCSTNQCSAPLFDFQGRYASGVGPVLIPGSGGGAAPASMGALPTYSAQLENPVPIEGLLEGDETFAFVLSEAVDGVDRNGDADAVPDDFVVTLRDRDTGRLQPIGPGGAEGRATVMVRQPPFAFPAVETEGDLLVFHESEPAQGYADANLNDDVFDSVLRVFRLGSPSAVEITDPADPPTADAAPLLDGRSAAASAGLVFFRTPESREAFTLTSLANVSSGGTQGNSTSQNPSFSADGRFVAFESWADNLVASDTNGTTDVFVHDRDADEDGVFDEPGAVATVRVSVDSSGGEANNGGEAPSISADGRFVAFESYASSLVPGDTNGFGDIFLHDRDADEDGQLDEIGGIATWRVSNALVGQPDADSSNPSLSADGRVVAFLSHASNLVPDDLNFSRDVFAYDELAGTTVRASVDDMGNGAAGDCFFASVSGDGRFVAFTTVAALVPDDTNLLGDIYLHDLLAGTTDRVSVDLDGGEADGGSLTEAISGDGRLIAFASAATNLVPGDTNSTVDIFVRDRDADADGVFDEPGEISITRVSVDSGGTQADGFSATPRLSADGRFVTFPSDATNLVPDDTNGATDIFVHDRVTGHTAALSVDETGQVGDTNSLFDSSPASADGAFVAFASNATNLVAGDANGSSDVFVRGPHPADLSADRSGDGALDDTLLRVLDTSVGPPGTVTDLCPAEAVSVDAGRAAFLRPETAGATSNAACSGAALGGPVLNADGDALDRVVHLYDGAVVQNLRCAATALALSATRIAALVSEAGEGGGSLNPPDSDTLDDVLHVRGVGGAVGASCATSGWINVGEPADALGVSGDVVAFITREADRQNGSSLNADADVLDRVIRLADGTTGALIPIVDDELLPDAPQAAEELVMGQALVAFRTPECAEGGAVTAGCPAGGTDLDGDGDAANHVLQVYVLATGQRINTGESVRPCRLVACDPRRPYRVSQSTVRFLTFEGDQNEDLNGDGDLLDLFVQVFNAASRTTEVVAEVVDTTTVSEPTTASDPLATPGQATGGEQVVVTRGRCVEDTLVACTIGMGGCGAGEFCFGDPGPAGTCVRDTGRTCFPDRPPALQGCLVGATCVADFAVLGVADADRDEVPDALDNCPRLANVDQADADLDGVGDVCDLETCGNNLIELDELCDDGNLVSGDGCDANCRTTACGNGVVTAGEGCDDGNLLDFDGCSSLCVREECRDGIDNDGDGDVDFPGDPGCASLDQPREFTGCDDDVDNDGDGTIDWDGGSGGGTPDSFCNGNPQKKREKPSCGLGFELALLLGALGALRRARRGGTARERSFPGSSGPRRPRGAPASLALIAALLLAFIAPEAAAICNVIPAATSDFRAALGSSNRPFAGPDDYVEVRVRPAICDGTSTGYVDVDGDGSRSDDHVVLVLFAPPAGPANATLLAEDCTGIDLASCAAQLGGGSAECVQVNGMGQPVGISVQSQAELQFRFPDTDARLGAVDDDRTLAGPAKVVVSRRSHPLQCQLATSRCADLGGDTSFHGVVACVDELYDRDGTCRTGTTSVSEVFGHFTALPPPNDFEALVDVPGITEMRLTTDAAGHVLIPMDYTGKLVRVEGVPIAQLGRAATSVDAFSAAPGVPVALPGDGFVASYTPEGVVLPPIFKPLSDPSDPTAATLFGSVDAPRGVIRVARRGCEGPGLDEGAACTLNGDCTSNVCSALLFDFSDRYASGVGPVLLSGVSGEYTAQVDTPVPLEGLIESDQTFAFVVSEGADGVDRNGDADAVPNDFVATLRDRDTGQLQPIGPGGADGRAAVRVREPPFAFPALEARDDLLAFLESEPAQGHTDENANGQVFDAILRVFQLGTVNAVEVTDPLAPLTAEPAPLVNGRSLATSAGRIFFRTSEAAEALRETRRVSVSSGGAQGNGPSDSPSISQDGRYVTFKSHAQTLVAGDTNIKADVFVHDRETSTTTRASVDSGGAQADGASYFHAISGDGRYVAFESDATNLVAGDTNSVRDIFVHDRDTGATTRVSVDSLGNEADDFNGWPAIAANGRHVAFRSDSANLVPGDGNVAPDIFVHDWDSGVTERASLDSAGLEGNASSDLPALSGDGRHVAFRSAATNLVSGDTNGTFDVFVRDRDLGVTERVSVDSQGNQGDGFSDRPSISREGRYVAFASDARNLVPGDTNVNDDIFVHDRTTGRTTRVSVDSGGLQTNNSSGQPVLSSDGRHVAFISLATNVVPDDTNGWWDVFVHDRLTGHTARVSLDSAGAEGNGNSAGPALSADGRHVVFQSSATVFVAGDTNGFVDVFVRGPDPADLAADRTGDGELDDTLLRVLDATAGPPGTVTDLCPAGAVAVAEGRAAFLRPEAAGATSNAACSGPDLSGPDLNADLDALDRVVHLYDGSAVHNLRCAAAAIALSSARVVALVSESDEAGADRNGDGDADDRVLHVRAVGAAAPASCADASWINVGQAGDAVGVAGDVVALITPEADQDTHVGGADLNGDGDAQDRVVRLVDGSTGSLIPIVDDQMQPDSPQAAVEFVLGAALLAFRTPEAVQGAADLNGDGDTLDDVLQLYVLATGERVNTGQAVRPCALVGCDPRRPYRVASNTVRFLTLESDQGQDLNDDGDQDDLLVQVYNVVAKQAEVVGEVVDTGTNPDTGFDPMKTPVERDSAATGQQTFVGTGRCVEDTGVSCTPGSCPAGEFCFTDPVSLLSTCVRDSGATCLPDKPEGEQGCDAGAVCARDLVVIGLADVDADEVPNAADNCPTTANVDQADADLDGVGDACDLQTCGNALPELDEECDDGNLVSGDGCDANCRATACGNGVVTAGEGCDDGNLLDFDGCSSLCVREECRDGIDNDGDGDVDFPGDPGCASLDQPREFTGCDDDVDNDGDGTIDWDGGSGGGTPDSFCNGNPQKKREKPRCGLGFELALLLALRPALRQESGPARPRR